MQDRTQQLAIVQRMIDAGESEANIAAVIQHFKQAAPVPVVPAAPTPARGTSYDPRNVPGNLQTLRNNAPMIGGMTAAAMTGGMGLPAVLAAGAGGAVGQAVKDAPESMPASDRFSNMALSGLGQMLTQGAGNAAAAMAPRMQQLARSLWNSAAKVSKPVARSTQTMRMGGSFEQAKSDIAETVLSQGKGTLRTANVDALRDRMRVLDDQIEQIVVHSKGLVSRDDIRRALLNFKAEIPKGTQAGDAGRAAVDASLKSLNQKPVRMTVEEAHRTKRHIYETYERSYLADAAEQVKAAADKTTGRALRTAIANEEPAVRPLDAELSRLIPAKKAMDEAVGRISNQSPVGLAQNIAAAKPGVMTLAASVLNHPRLASFSAQQIYNAAAKLPKNAQTVSNIFRLAKAMTPVASHTQTGRD